MSGSSLARIGLVGVACGIILLYSLALLPPLHWLIFAVALALVVLVLASSPAARLAAMAGAGLIAGLAWAVWHADARQQAALPAELEGERLQVSGYLCEVPSEGSFSSVRFAFCVDQWHLPEHSASEAPAKMPGRIRLAWYGDDATTRLAQTLRLDVVLKRPQGAINPHGFRYESWLYRKGFGATGTVRDLVADDSVECGPVCNYHRWRNGLVSEASLRLEDARHFPLILSLMIGYRGHMEPHHWDVLKATGTIHLVAISGLHLGLIAAGAGFLCRRLLLQLPERWVPPERLRQTVFFCVCAASLAYALAAGFSVPTRRALIMVVIAGWVLVRASKTTATTGLLWALVLVLLSDPFSPLDQGFWLSFGAVSVLVLVFSLRLRQAGWFQGLLLAQMAVFVTLWPILELLGQSQVVTGFVANLFAIPWVSLVVMPVLVAGALVMAVSPAADGLVIAVYDWVFGVLWQALLRLADMPLVMPTLGITALVLLAAVVMMALMLPLRGFRLATTGLLLVWVVAAATRETGEAPGNTRVATPELWVWDVGQGLSVMVRHRNRVLVYDTGPALEGVYSAVESVLVPNLRALGVNRIDTLVISHGDSDHAGGLSLLSDSFGIGGVITGEPERIADRLTGVSTIKSCAGQTDLMMAGLALSFWRSPEDVDGNDASCVLTIRSESRQVEIVIPGDITADAEAAFIASAAPRSGYYRVVLAPHHGSKTSSSEQWVRAMAPDLAVFSAGYQNRFGHPHEDVTSRYRLAGSRMLNTATSGALQLIIQQGEVTVAQARVQTPFWIRKPPGH